MLALGTSLPKFALPEVSTGRLVQTSDFEECRVLVVVFLSAHCPYVVHVRPELVRLAADYAQKGVGFVGITSNDVTQYPEDAPAKIAAMARSEGLKFPILFDQSQSVAKAFTAACTPDFFLFDAAKQLAYRGQLDSSRPSRGAGKPPSGALDGSDLRAALDAVLAGWPASTDQRPSVGCNIKWRRGNEPDYFVL
jgi:peroxiredoxin